MENLDSKEKEGHMRERLAESSGVRQRASTHSDPDHDNDNGEELKDLRKRMQNVGVYSITEVTDSESEYS